MVGSREVTRREKVILLSSFAKDEQTSELNKIQYRHKNEPC